MTDTPPATDLEGLRPLLERRDQIRAEAAHLVTDALEHLGGPEDRPVRASILREAGPTALGAIITMRLIVTRYGGLLRQNLGEPAAVRVLGVLREETVRVVAEGLAAQGPDATQAGATIENGVTE